jgi:hypothetical protein
MIANQIVNKITNAIKISELYLEIDKLKKHKMVGLFKKKNLLKNPNDTLQYYSSLQSELLLHGFVSIWITEAQKKTSIRKKKTSTTVYTFHLFLHEEGINWYEMDSYPNPKTSFHKQLIFQPKQMQVIRYKINKNTFIMI